MDLTFVFEPNIVHLRARGVIMDRGRLLCLRDIYPYWYQVGGRIAWGESSLEAMHRELREELHLENYRISRPLFLSEHTVFRRGRNNQEFVIYYLIDISNTNLLDRGESFETIDDDQGIHHEWKWMKEDEIRSYGFYPEPLLSTMFSLPEKFTIISTHEDEFRTDHDMTFNMEGRWLNIRVASVFLHDGAILAMKDGKAPFFYLPGGRLHFGETLEEAAIREVGEEVQIEPHLLRPIRISENFFESVNHPGEKTHEICVYFLFETTKELLERGRSFKTMEEQEDTFSWIRLEELKNTEIMPPFLKTEALDIEDELILTVDRS